MKLLLVILFFLPQIINAQIGGGITQTMQDHAPKYGALTQTNLSSADDAAITKDSLECRYIRIQVNVSAWNGNIPAVNDALAKGLKVIPVLRYGGSPPQPFVTSAQLAGYLDTIELIVDTYNFDVVTVENEEVNTNYHTTSLDDYGAMLQGVYAICHPRGIKVMNGGVYGDGLNLGTYRFVKNVYGSTIANAYGAACMFPSEITAANNPGSNSTLETKLSKIDTVVSYHAYYDYINNHPYEVFSKTSTQQDTVTMTASNVLRFQQIYLEFVTGKPCISNEMGQRESGHPELTTSSMNEVYRLGWEYVIFYNSLGAGSDFPLSDYYDGHTLPTGIAFKNFVITHQ